MRVIILLLFAVIGCAPLFAQNTFKAIIKDAESKETLPSVVVFIKELNISGSTDENGGIESRKPTCRNSPTIRGIRRFGRSGYFDDKKFPNH